MHNINKNFQIVTQNLIGAVISAFEIRSMPIQTNFFGSLLHLRGFVRKLQK